MSAKAVTARGEQTTRFPSRSSPTRSTPITAPAGVRGRRRWRGDSRQRYTAVRQNPRRHDQRLELVEDEIEVHQPSPLNVEATTLRSPPDGMFGSGGSARNGFCACTGFPAVLERSALMMRPSCD